MRVTVKVYVLIVVTLGLGIIGGVVSLVMTRKPCPGGKETISMFGLLKSNISNEDLVRLVRKHDGTNANGTVNLAGGFKTDSQIARYDWVSGAHPVLKESEIRERILHLFGTNSTYYSVIFTKTADDALRLFVESFPWTSGSTYWYHQSSDASLLSLRRYAARYNSYFLSLNESILSRIRRISDLAPIDSRLINAPDNLLAIPLQESFSGTKLDRGLMRGILMNASEQLFVAGETCAVLADGTDFTVTSSLSLADLPFHGLAVSFEKMFGFPYLGGLIVQNAMFDYLRRRSRGARSLKAAKIWAIQETPYMNHVRSFEDMEISDRDLGGIALGLDIYERLGMSNIQNRAWTMTRLCYEQLSRLCHSNGANIVVVYGRHSLNDQTRQGNTVTFNVIRKNSTFVHFLDVVKSAKEHQLRLRGGCLSSPGACYVALGLTEQRVIGHMNRTAKCQTKRDVIDGIPLGAVKVEFNWASVQSDIDALVSWINSTYYE